VSSPPTKWEVLASQTHFDDSHVLLATEKVRTPTRPQACAWTTIHRKPAVVVAPLTRQNKFVLIRQERIPIRDTIWEFPAGQIDGLCDAGSFKDVALRELKEETGYHLASDGELTLLGEFYSSPGFTDERAFLLRAAPVELSASGCAHENSEAILDCREFSLDELRHLISSGEVRDANTLSAFARLSASGLLPGH
jgi:ADP-ribose pyrophosphatase